jgi:hypothetical protein
MPRQRESFLSPAGPLTAAGVGGSLTVTGDALDNAIAVIRLTTMVNGRRCFVRNAYPFSSGS